MNSAAGCANLVFAIASFSAFVTNVQLGQPLDRHEIASQDKGVTIVSIAGIAVGAAMGDPVSWWKTQGLVALARYEAGEADFQIGKVHQSVRAAKVTAEFFSVFGESTLEGRIFQAQDNLGLLPVAVISRSFWEAELGRSRDVLTGEVLLAGTRCQIMGIVNGDFDFPASSQVWILESSKSPALARSKMDSKVATASPVGWIGRVRSGVSLEQLHSELQAVLSKTNSRLSPVTGISYGDSITVTEIRR